MDDRRFDLLARALGAASSRRGVLAALIAVTAAGAGLPGAESRRRRRRCDPACSAGQTCRQGTCRCDDGGTVCGAICCAIGQRCEGGRCLSMPEPDTCVAFGQPCKGVGLPCCDGVVCGSGQDGQGDVACYVPAGGACQATADCVYDATCQQGACVANPQPTPAPPGPPCNATFPATADAGANGLALQQAVIDAVDGDTIVLAPGDYRFDAMQTGASIIAGIWVSLKTITIERCNAEAVVTLSCPSSAGLFACVAVDRNGTPTMPSLTLRGVTVTQQGSGTGVLASSADLALEDTAVEVEAVDTSPVMVAAIFPSRAIIKSGVSLRTTNPNPTSAALFAETSFNWSVASVECESEPAYVGYPTSGQRCRTAGPGSGTITEEACGCP